jgi:hypothetical protein
MHAHHLFRKAARAAAEALSRRDEGLALMELGTVLAAHKAPHSEVAACLQVWCRPRGGGRAPRGKSVHVALDGMANALLLTVARGKPGHCVWL